MKIRIIDGSAKHDGEERDVLDAAGRRLIAAGRAEEVGGKAAKSEAKADGDAKPAKKSAKKPAKKSSSKK